MIMNSHAALGLNYYPDGDLALDAGQDSWVQDFCGIPAVVNSDFPEIPASPTGLSCPAWMRAAVHVCLREQATVRLGCPSWNEVKSTLSRQIKTSFFPGSTYGRGNTCNQYYAPHTWYTTHMLIHGYNTHSQVTQHTCNTCIQ